MGKDKQGERKRKGEHLFKRGGLWFGWVNVPVYVDGKRTHYKQVKRSLGTRSIVRARVELAAWEAEQADPAAALIREATFGAAWDSHEKDRKALVLAGKRSEASLEFYDMVARAWLLYAGRRLEGLAETILDDSFDKARKLELRERGRTMALMDFDQRFRDAFVEHRRRNETADTTIGKNLVEARSALYLMKRAGKFAGDLDVIFPPFECASKPKRVVMTHAEARRLLEAFSDQPHHRAMVAYVLASGAETAAIARALRPDLDAVPIPLRGTKTTDRDRSAFVVFDWQRELLQMAKAGLDGEGVAAFKPWANSSRDLHLACSAAKVPDVTLHGLRHVFGAWALDDGISEALLAKALGHADTRMVMTTYDHREAETMQRRAAEQASARHQVRLQVIEGGKAKTA